MLATLLAVGALTLSATVAEAGPKRIRTGPIDSVDFQALVDGAEPGTTIECEAGVYDFSPGSVSITKTIHIVAADPADPPIFQGDGSGYGFYFPPRSDELHAGRLAGLHFRNFARAILVNGSIDFDAPGCPATGGSVKGLEIVDSRMTDVQRGVQIITRAKNITVRDNEIEALAQALFVLGDSFNAGACGDLSLGRVSGLHVSGNTLSGRRLAALIMGTENTLVRGNTMASLETGMLFGDRTAEFFGDDGPVRFGNVEQNVITAPYPLELLGPTTMGASSVQNNVLDAGEVAITVWHGGNGFKISNNTFLPTGSYADIWLGGATASDDFPPDSHDNTVVAGASVTRVLDFGRDNKLLGQKIVLLNPGPAPLALARLNGHKARVLAEITTQ